MTKRVKAKANSAARAFARRARVFLREKHGIVYSNPPKKAILLSQIERLIGYTPTGSRVSAAIEAMNGVMDFKGKLAPRRPPIKGTFYESREWQELRYQALKANSGKCELCGASKRTGAVLHVDHIKPRSLYRDLELELSNLQVLCGPCNLGKSNKDETDWR